uniref:Autophagy-related protein 18 n=1 Tax=Aureoumbra lagunensis TaxID=44058 RepID=A0A7S3JWF9_9STRA|mmetsp:Transcript_20762/g.26864  ORF Transcript_20762/g.26864 Transcript_20762/m.26864 type:complete len:449 (+) Transcript_20762:81-1427(+)
MKVQEALKEEGNNKVEKSELLFVSFNQDFGCFACGTESGFRIYNVDPFKETFRRAFRGGGIGIVEMLFRCNLLALVGGGSSPRYPPNKVMIWDDHQNRCIGELSFRSEVKAVKLRRDRVVVALATKVYVYRFSDLKLLDQISTQVNSRGLAALCADPAHNVLACPGVNKGHVRIELYDSRKSTIVAAHESDLCRLALNSDGSLVATASDKGTLVRIFDTHTGAQVRELRRGVDRAIIYAIAFDPDSKYVACTSDKGTAHVFSIQSHHTTQASSEKGTAFERTNSNTSSQRHIASSPPNASLSGRGGTTAQGAQPNNAKSNLSFLRRVVPGGLASSYLESEWSFAQVHGLEAPTICAFGTQPNTLVLVGADGSFLVSNFARGGEAERLTFAKFLNSSSDTARGGGGGESDHQTTASTSIPPPQPTSESPSIVTGASEPLPIPPSQQTSP